MAEFNPTGPEMYLILHEQHHRIAHFEQRIPAPGNNRRTSRA
jgi:hypothetical protein